MAGTSGSANVSVTRSCGSPDGADSDACVAEVRRCRPSKPAISRSACLKSNVNRRRATTFAKSGAIDGLADVARETSETSVTR